MGTDALYVNMSDVKLFKLEIVKLMHENTFEDLTVVE